jgi:hypothetical protein
MDSVFDPLEEGTTYTVYYAFANENPFGTNVLGNVSSI